MDEILACLTKQHHESISKRFLARKLQLMVDENRIQRTGTDYFQIRPRTTSTPLPGKLSLPSFATPSSFRVTVPNSPLSSTDTSPTSPTPPILAPISLADCTTPSVVPDVLPDLPVFLSVAEPDKKEKAETSMEEEEEGNFSAATGNETASWEENEAATASSADDEKPAAPAAKGGAKAAGKAPAKIAAAAPAAKKAAAPKKTTAAATKKATPSSPVSPKAKPAAAMKKSSAPGSASSHPPYLDMITEAIETLKERNGSSRQAITKYIAGTHNIDVKDKRNLNYIKQALKRGMEKGKIINVKVRYYFLPPLFVFSLFFFYFHLF